MEQTSNRIRVQTPIGLPRQALVKYLDNCLRGLPALQDAIQRMDCEFIRVYGHGMKGCGAPYGFPKLTEIGAALEQSAKAGDIESIQRYTLELRDYLEAVELEA